MFTEIDDRILRYVPKSKQKAVRACWHDSDGYWIELHEGYNADRMDWHCHTIHEDTIAELRYQIAGIGIDKEYWEENQMEESTATTSVVYEKDNGIMAEIIEQDRFTALLHVINGNEREYCVSIRPVFDDENGTFTSRVDSLFATLEEARSAQEIYEISQRTEHFKKICREVKEIINENSEGYFYDFQTSITKSIGNYGLEDLTTGLALYLKQHDWDGRISDRNKKWAKEQLQGTKNDNLERFGVEMAHPAVMDGFADNLRKTIALIDLCKTKAPHWEPLYSLLISGNRDAVEKIKNYSEIIGLGIEDYDNAPVGDNTLTIRVTEQFEKEITELAKRYGVSCIVEKDSMDRLIRLINEWCEVEHGEPANFSNRDHIELAYTTDPDTGADIEAFADIDDYRIVKLYDGHVVSETYYENVPDMGDVFLNLTFDDLTTFDENEKKKVEEIKNYPIIPTSDNGRK